MKNRYRQMQAVCRDRTVTALSGKKGNLTVKARRTEAAGTSGAPGAAGTTGTSGVSGTPGDLAERKRAELTHDRKKKYILPEGVPVPFLVSLGVMTPEGKVTAKYSDKFRQINRFLEYIRDVEPALPSDRCIRIIDFGCGKSYLTFAIYYYLHELRGRDVSIIGLDLKENVIERCNALAKECGYTQLHFQTGDIARYQAQPLPSKEEDGAEENAQTPSLVDMVVTLHACDTATDEALAKAVGWGAGVILSVPCCQHELNGQIQSELLSPVLRYGILKERMSALITDGLRANLLEEAGYQVQVLEFIDMEHTPKNLLIRAVKAPRKISRMTKSGKSRADERRELESALHVQPRLESLLG